MTTALIVGTTIQKQVVLFGMAMLPIVELRGAIPFGLLTEPKLHVLTTYVLAVVGNFAPVIPILLLLDPVSRSLRKVRLFDRLLTWLFARTRRRGRLIERYEAIGLAMFVAIPLPVTGAWTGALAAFLFGIRLRYAAISIMAGILVAGVIVTLASMGVIGILHLR